MGTASFISPYYEETLTSVSYTAAWTAENFTYDPYGQGGPFSLLESPNDQLEHESEVDYGTYAVISSVVVASVLFAAYIAKRKQEKLTSDDYQRAEEPSTPIQ